MVDTSLTWMVLVLGVLALLSRPCKKSNHLIHSCNEFEQGSEFLSFCRYGSTKCGLRQFHGSIVKESQKTNVGLHTASPGMVLTELLLRYACAYTLSHFSSRLLQTQFLNLDLAFQFTNEFLLNRCNKQQTFYLAVVRA